MEIILWSFSRNQKAHDVNFRKASDFQDFEIYQQEVLEALIQRIKVKSPSMRPRGVAFAIESLANLNY